MSDSLKDRLSPLAWNVTQNKGTEPPYSGKYDQFDQPGAYHCVCCGKHIFDSSSKFDSGCGWPAFFQAVDGATNETQDHSHGMSRIEITCANCDAHLGHVFPDGPYGTRYCINSVSMEFTPKHE